ncbi:unnamed protein product [Leuciscus chuanchicus]
MELWERQLGALIRGQSYDIMNVFTREFGGDLFLTASGSTEMKEVAAFSGVSLDASSAVDEGEARTLTGHVTGTELLDNTVFALRKVENAVKPVAEEEDLLGEGEVTEMESWFAEGPLPDPYMMASGSKLSQVQLQPLMAVVLDGVSEMELTPSKFGSVPRGSPMSYHCPPKKSSDLLLHHMAPEFPSLPLMQHTFPRLHFVLTLHQLMPLQSLEVSPQLSSEIAKETQQQSKCPAWTQLRRPRLTASRFWDACCSRACRAELESAAIQMIIGSTKQTAAMKRGLLVEPEVMANYAELLRVNVLPAGFIIHPDAPHLGASPDGRVYDPSESPPFGLVEVDGAKMMEQNSVQVCIRVRPLIKRSGESPQPPPVCSTNLDDATAAILCQNAHHTPAYWWRGDSDEANQYMGMIRRP